jgi:hypothetical protein
MGNASAHAADFGTAPFTIAIDTFEVKLRTYKVERRAADPGHKVLKGMV